MLGDTMNTAARIELGAIALRGKEGDVRLSALTRA